ncbi:MAG: SurA N-terminal domain-containing protein [Blastochloris sp.]|nr:SurA N-terminal domain-containing protein [Blastochloris sp.]
MLTLLSSKLRILLIIFLIILGVSFIFFDHGHMGPAGSNPRLAQIDGKAIKRSDFEEAFRDTNVLYILQTGRRPVQQLDAALRAQTWNRLLLLQAGREAKIEPTTTEAVNFIKTHPLFLDEKNLYSPSQFQTFNLNVLKPQGISEERFQSIVQDQLIYEQMLKTLLASAIVRPSEIEEVYTSLYGQASLKYVALSEAPIRNSIKPSQDELKAFYLTQQDKFLTPELKKIDYVLFSLKPDQLKLPEDKKAILLRELTEQAYQFTEPFFSSYSESKPMPSFKEAADRTGLKVATTSFLAQNEPLISTDPTSLDLTRLAFTLRPASPVSDYQKTTNGLIVLHLAESQPAAALPFEKVQKEVELLYLNKKTSEILAEKGKLLAKNLQAAIASGKNWEQAAESENLKPVTVPAFSPAKDTVLKTPAADAIRFWAQRLKVGAVSEFSTTSDGGMVFYLMDRQVPNETNRAQAFAGIEGQLQQQRRSQILDDWMNARIKMPGNNIPADLLKGEMGQNL